MDRSVTSSNYDQRPSLKSVFFQATVAVIFCGTRVSALSMGTQPSRLSSYRSGRSFI